MPITLPSPLWISSVMRLRASDENPILQRLYERDEALLNELQAVANTREDLFQQFGRLDDLEKRWKTLNEIINKIVATFYTDLNEDGVADWDGDVEFFRKLIRDLKDALSFVDQLSTQIIRYQDIQDLLLPEVERINQIEDLDRLVRYKLAFIYNRWDVDPQDDILSNGGTLPLAAWDDILDMITVTIETNPVTSPGLTPNVQSAVAFNGALAGEANNPGPTPYAQFQAGVPVYGDTFQIAAGKAFIDTPSLTKVLLIRLGWATSPAVGDTVTVTISGLGQTITVADVPLPTVGFIDPITGANGRAISFRIHGVDKSIEAL